MNLQYNTHIFQKGIRNIILFRSNYSVVHMHGMVLKSDFLKVVFIHVY